MHVDRKADPAEADQGYAQFLLPHGAQHGSEAPFSGDRGETEIVRFTDALPFSATRTDDGRNGRKPGEAGSMIRSFKHYIPNAVFLSGSFDFFSSIASGESGWIVRARQIGLDFGPINERWAPSATFAVSVQVAMISVGVYGSEASRSSR
ncbi:hypothetical protein OY671_008933, partial [Metschnikowia pulcherrima]